MLYGGVTARSSPPRFPPCGRPHVHARHEHPNPVQPRSNPTRPRFPQRRFFGTPTSLSFFPSPPGKVEKSNINKATTVVVHPPPDYEFLRKAPEFLGFTLCNRPALAVSSQPFGVIGGRQGLLPLRCRRSPSYCCTRLFDDPAGVTVRPASSSPDTSIRVRRPIGGADREHWSRGLRSVVEEVLEEVLFEVEAGVRHIVTDKTVRGGEAVK